MSWDKLTSQNKWTSSDEYTIKYPLPNVCWVQLQRHCVFCSLRFCLWMQTSYNFMPLWSITWSRVTTKKDTIFHDQYSSGRNTNGSRTKAMLTSNPWDWINLFTFFSDFILNTNTNEQSSGHYRVSDCIHRLISHYQYTSNARVNREYAVIKIGLKQMKSTI